MSDRIPLSPTPSASVHSRHSAEGGEGDAQRLTVEELRVLQHTSLVNGMLHLPWIGDDEREPFDLSEHYTHAAAMPAGGWRSPAVIFVHGYSDPAGLLKLSSRQLERYQQWLRPHQFLDRTPVMIKRVSSKKISQEVVTNCSFVASLCVCADYEQRFKKRLITRCIYPQDQRGRPYYNAWGKYMIKLLINGIHRKILIDDRVPVDRENRPLAVTTADQELWPMLIEKAYLKVQGGYDFPGSNSGIDMHALTGWIPEHVLLQESPPSAASSDIIWRRLYAGLHSGRALGTLATGQVDAIDQDWLWLVPNHAYAILEAVELPDDVRDDGGDTRMLRCKNPWRQHGWQGCDGPDDVHHWHPRLRRMLAAYNMAEAAADGEFWIGWSAVCRYFDTLHLSWDPDQFPCRFTVHAAWPMALGPAIDRHCFAWNPQYSLRISTDGESDDGGSSRATVWLLLSRHMEAVEADNRDYITMHVYATHGGERIFYPVEPTAVKGVYVNNPHVLQERTRSLYYTLNVYANVPFSFRETPGFAYACEVGPGSIVALFVHLMLSVLKTTDAWTVETAGGNNTYDSWIDNPQYRLDVAMPAYVYILLDLFDVADGQSAVKAMHDQPPSMVAAKIDLFTGGDRIDRWAMAGKHMAAAVLMTGRSVYRYLAAHSGDYRMGFAYAAISLDPGAYVVLLSTYDKGTPAPYKLTIASDVPGLQLARL
ncbi:hypothetical protein SYNPS1DRAFT_27214 [Syncephalis pseudoplumigaleata]|uniref:Calpain catalytic domain-containing protein n=1 Tax=Syncephalis pseudoplumigaleata TaxID=1712513 RepID=A0A4V1J229_9FUNG|nr:hypothetical protein SYNPS1DRAFT_27214 [Syncephalis pseudoplumigaleata]|eukprot:RKP27119.1 hypothetical protein SYNPS1DRAFT_27214 [Syncephalis pseudoplumigaleata]